MSFTKKPRTINPDEVDPSVYYYDEVYDSLKDEDSAHDEKQVDKTTKKQGSKYIQGIIESADRRKSEKEIRKFKRYARDREEAEAKGELEDTEVYISHSYEKKLKEVRDVLERNSQYDGDRTLNSFKKHRSHSDNKDPQSMVVQASTSKSTKDVADIELETVPVQENSQSGEKRKRPKTIEERREYLRDVLRKQTVGKVFEEAVQRYKQRKAQAS